MASPGGVPTQHTLPLEIEWLGRECPQPKTCLFQTPNTIIKCFMVDG
jgi:hypothetical protein